MHSLPPNHDLETYLFQDHNSQNNRHADSPNNMTNLQNTLNFSLKFNSVKLFISSAKIVASIVVFVPATSCMDSKAIWILLMLAHDFLNSVITIMTIHVVWKVNREIQNNILGHRGGRQRQGDYDRFRETQLAYGQLYDAPNEELNVDFERTSRDQERQNRNTRALFLARETAKRQRLINLLTSAIETLYLTLFVYGQVIFFLDNNPQCYSKPVENILLTYLIMAYIWVLSPVAMVLLACLCLPVLMFFFYLFGRVGPVSANRVLIEDLEVKNFTRDLPGNHECTICMVEYKEDEKIVQFKCSPMHHFHEACIKRWLGINGQCPICRMRLEDM